MYALTVVCYTVGALCFLASVKRHRLTPESLDLVALGLFLWVLPTLIKLVIQFG